MLAKYTFELPGGEVRLVRHCVNPLLTTRSSDPVNDARSHSVRCSGAAQPDECIAQPRKRVIGR